MPEKAELAQVPGPLLPHTLASAWYNPPIWDVNKWIENPSLSLSLSFCKPASQINNVKEKGKWQKENSNIAASD